MKKFVIPLLCILAFTGCSNSDETTTPHGNQTVASEDGTVVEGESKFTYTNQLAERKKEIENTKALIAENITDPNVKANVEAGIELGVIGEDTVIDFSTDEKTFESNSIKTSLPEGFTKTTDSGIVTGIEKRNENGASTRISFSQSDQNSPSRQFEGMTDEDRNYTAAKIKERYLPQEGDTAAEVPEEERTLKTTTSLLTDTDTKIVVKNLTTNKEGATESIAYAIWDNKAPSKIISLYVSTWGENDQATATAYDDWVTKIEVK